MRKPFFRTRQNSWWIKDVNGKTIRLGKTRQEAYDNWHAMASNRLTSKTAGITVGFVIGEFLTWTKTHKAANTYKWYCGFLAGRDGGHAFGQVYGDLPITDLRPTDLEKWIDRQYGKSTENGRNGAKRAVMRCFNWAVKKRHCKENPLTGADIYSSPGSGRLAGYQPRRTYLSEDQWTKLIEAVDPSDWLHDFLWFLRETGCRPHEARIIEARHFLRDSRLIVIGRDEAKGKKRDRVIPLNDEALAIVQRLALKNPTGTLFRTRRNVAVTTNTLTTRLDRLTAKLGFKIHAYMLRRTFITDGLTNGLTADVLQIVVGHSSTQMISTVYNAMESKASHLVDAVKQARRGIA